MNFMNAFLNFAISIVISELTRPRLRFDKPKAAGLDEFSFPTATENRPIPVIWGTAQIKAPNTLAAGDLKTRTRYKKVKDGLFRTAKQPLGIEYRLGMELGICVGGGVELLEVWAGDKRVFAGTATHGDTVVVAGSWKDGEQSSGVRATCEWHSPRDASEAIVSSYMAALVSTNPSYQHISRLVWRGPSAGGGSGFVGLSPHMRALAFVCRRFPDVAKFGVPSAELDAYQNINGGDANPAYALLELVTNEEWGGTYPAPLLDIESFRAAAAVLHAEGNGLSMTWDGVQKVEDIKQQLERQMNGSLVEDPRTGLLRLKLIREYDESVLTITHSNLVRIESYTRAAGDDATNELRLPFKDRAANFFDRSTLAQDLGGIRQQGQVISATIQYPGVSNATLASTLVMRDLIASVTPLAKSNLIVSVDPGTVVLPGDVVTLQDVAISDTEVVTMRKRVLKVSLSLRRPEIRLDCLQDVFSAGTALYAGQVPPLPEDAGSFGVPGDADWRYIHLNPPFGLVGDDSYQYLLFYAGAPTSPNAGASGYELGWWQGETDAAARTFDTATFEPEPLEFAVRGTLAGSVERDSLAPFSIPVNEGDAAVISRNAGWDLVAMLWPSVFASTPEYLRVRVMLDAGGTTATVTPLARGIFGSIPVNIAAGGFIELLYGFAVQPAPLSATSTQARAVTRGPGGIQDFDEDGRADTDASLFYAGGAIQPKPYPAADIQLAGVAGNTSNAGTHPTAPTSAATTLSWKPRDKRAQPSDRGYYEGDAAWEQGVSIYLQAFYTPPGGSLTVLHDGPPSSATAQTLDMSGVPSGSAVFVRIYTSYNPMTGDPWLWNAATADGFWLTA